MTSDKAGSGDTSVIRKGRIRAGEALGKVLAAVASNRDRAGGAANRVAE